MKALLLTDSDVFAGTERHVAALGRGLRALAVSVVVGCPEPSPLAERVRSAGVEVVAIAKGGLLDWRAVRALRRVVRERGVDVVHAHNGRTGLIGAVALWGMRGETRPAGSLRESLGRLEGKRSPQPSRGVTGEGVPVDRGVRLVVTQHFLSPAHVGRGGVMGWLSRAVHRWVNRRVDHYIAISEAAREEMISRGDVEAGRISVVWNGVELPASPEIPDSKLHVPNKAELSSSRTGCCEWVVGSSDVQSVDELRAGCSTSNVQRSKFNVPGDEGGMVVYVGRLEAEKDVGTLVEAMGEVVKARPGAVCAIAGSGSEEGALRGLVERLGLDDSVVLMGYIENPEEVMRAGDLFVLPSLAEPFGLVLLEAMALGKAVVATRAGGPREIVVEGETGLLVEPGDAREMAEAIVGLLREPQRREEMGRHGRERFLEQFTADRMARETLRVYQTILSLSPADESASAAEPVRA
jgi:glycosyltransferase involved in cell wall biosynthesis